MKCYCVCVCYIKRVDIKIQLRFNLQIICMALNEKAVISICADERSKRSNIEKKKKQNATVSICV